jgi:hypothetical protein
MSDTRSPDSSITVAEVITDADVKTHVIVHPDQVDPIVELRSYGLDQRPGTVWQGGGTSWIELASGRMSIPASFVPGLVDALVEAEKVAATLSE